MSKQIAFQMPDQSNSYKSLEKDLGDIDIAIEAIKGPPRGADPSDINKKSERDKERVQSKILFQSCYVMQYAAFELFVENLFEECDKFENEQSTKNTLCSIAKDKIRTNIERNHGATPDKIDKLFMMVGIPFITYYPINWQGKGNSRKAIRNRLKEHTKKRALIAHGKFRESNAVVTRQKLNNARTYYLRLAKRLEVITAQNLKKRRDVSPYWGEDNHIP